MRNTFVIALFLVVSTFNPIHGQGWEKAYNGGRFNLFTSVIETADNGYLALGNSSLSDTNETELYLQKVDIDGNEQWSKFYGDPNFNATGWSMSADENGGIIVMANLSYLFDDDNKTYLLKVDENGTEEWSGQFDYGDEAFSNKILPTQDGGYFLSNTQKNSDKWYGKISSLGVEEWNYTVPADSAGLGHMLPADMVILSDGYLITSFDKLIKLNLLGEEVWIQTMEGTDKIAAILSLVDGNFMLTIDSDTDHRLSKRNADGIEIWSAPIDVNPYLNTTEIEETDDGGFLVVCSTSPSIIQSIRYGVMVKTNNIGVEEWRKELPDIFVPFSLLEDSFGNFILAGNSRMSPPDGSSVEGPYLIKTDNQGNLYSNYITGTVFTDDNQNCTFEEASEDGFEGRLVQFEGNDKSFFGMTDSTGNYTINVDTGTYEVSVILPNPYWTNCDQQTVNVTEFYSDINIDLAAKPTIECPWLTVDISTPFLRRCFENNYTVHYCNDGTISAEDAYIEVDFDQFLEVQSSNLPWTSQIGNTYTFEVGTLDPADCGSFNVTALLSCDSTILGQTHCTDAHIFPDSICLPDAADWDGSSVAVEAACDGDSVRFIIRNIGDGNMVSPLNYIIIEDEIMVYQDDFQLDAGQSEMLANAYSSGGSTYRIIAEQADGHPGNSMPTAAIEGCGTTIFPFGFFNSFSQNDGDFYLSIDCQENVGAYDPNDKQAFPTGYGDEHYIWQNVDLEYLIRFQNTGTDTAFTVVIRDTISEHLDITSLQMGASSHNYTYTIDGEGILKVRFDNILLPDSTTNLLGSNGFFKYKIKQQQDLPLGTMIYNEAAIYFDFNAPIITNETYHEVGEPFFETTVFTNDLTTNNIKLNVFPNPFGDFTTFEIENLPEGKTDFLLYDNLGRLVREEPVLNLEQFQFYREGLAAGLYFFEFRQAGVSVASGKMVAE